jgi:hypothetical protein
LRVGRGEVRAAERLVAVVHHTGAAPPG